LEATIFHAGCAVTGVITGAQDVNLLNRAAGVAETNVARWAQLLIIAAEGAVLIARAQRSVEPLRLVAEQFSGLGT
jgi:Transcriptional regulator LmrA/YxaF-like, C-terminal domain